MELTKEDPGRSGTGQGRGRTDWRAYAERLQAEPGEWFVVFEGPHAAARVLANRLKGGDAAGWTPGQFEATSRVSGPQTTKVHARYTGDGA